MTDSHTRKPSTYGFKRTGTLVQSRIRRASESRGFAVSRVVTHWAEIAGSSVAAISRPVEISYSKGGMGATLVLLTTGPNAPMLEMQKTQIRDRVNACYGYNAISRVRITQTAPTGFAEGQVAFDPAPKAKPEPAADVRREAENLSQDVANTELRLAIELLATNVLSKAKPKT